MSRSFFANILFHQHYFHQHHEIQEVNVGEGFSPTYRFFTNMHFSPTSFTNIRTAIKITYSYGTPKSFFGLNFSRSSRKAFSDNRATFPIFYIGSPTRHLHGVTDKTPRTYASKNLKNDLGVAQLYAMFKQADFQSAVRYRGTHLSNF